MLKQLFSEEGRGIIFVWYDREKLLSCYNGEYEKVVMSDVYERLSTYRDILDVGYY
jgi:hypothetical protein